MTENRVKLLLKQGHPTFGCWLRFASPSVAELMANVLMDWLVIDVDHSPADWETVEDMVRAMKGSNVVPLIRVASNDPVPIKKALDRGALGVVVPFISTADQARAAVMASKYPPEGTRGISLNRSNWHGVDFVRSIEESNGQILVICVLETLEVVRNANAIAEVQGVDVLFVGKNDLSANLTRFRELDDAEFKHAVADAPASQAESERSARAVSAKRSHATRPKDRKR